MTDLKTTLGSSHYAASFQQIETETHPVPSFSDGEKGTEIKQERSCARHSSGGSLIDVFLIYPVRGTLNYQAIGNPVPA